MRASTLDLVARLADAADRGPAAAALAERLGVDALLIFVRDVQLSVLVPAPGFPQTLPGGPSWRALLRRCAHAGAHVGDVAVSFSDARRVSPARAWVLTDGSAVVLVGGAPVEVELALVLQAAPLLAAALRGEQVALAAAGHIEVARVAERQARTLAHALDGARADLEHALAEAARLGRERVIVAESLQKKSEEALQSAEETAQLRERFIAILAHDLRTPLGAILLTAEALLECGGDADELVDHAARIRRSGTRIARMVDDLLDFARTSAGGGMPIRPRPIDDLAAFFGPIVDEMGTAYPSRRITLELGPAPRVWWDSDRMAQVLSNLIGNALTHGPEDTDVRVGARAEGDLVLVQVHNLGPPIAPALLLRIFEPFQRGSDAGTGVRSGLGLGLYITMTIVRAHGGEIAVSSSAGEGTTFTVRLPRRAPGAC